MALRIVCTAARNWKNYSICNGQARNFFRSEHIINNLLTPQTPICDTVRSVSFLNKITGAELWKSATSVSNAGKKRGRGKLAAKGLTKDLNLGQVIGQGRRKLNLPGMNAPVKLGSEIGVPSKGVDDPCWNEKLYNLRDMNKIRRRMKVGHVERGYSGTRLAGRSVGSPQPIGQVTFDGFDSRCIEMKIVTHMHGHLGRSRQHSCFVVTGNGEGVCGFALGKSTDPKAAIRKAKNKAATKLLHFQICDGHTVYHDFFTQFGYTKIYGYKMPEGFGLKQNHRIIRTLCNLIGIKDLITKIEGSTNPQAIVKAFLVGLLQQKTYNQIAEEKKLYVMEFDERRGCFPRIVGVPSYCRTREEIPKDENTDYKQYVLNGKVTLKRPPRQNPWAKLPTYKTYLKRTECKRAWPETKFHLRVRYGELRSFLTDKYPETVGQKQDKY